MGLLLCDQLAEQPFYYEKLDKNVYSIQELSYLLYHYPAVISDDFVNSNLLNWFQTIGMEEFSETLHKSLDVGVSQDKLILRILRESNYYTEQEILGYDKALRNLRDMEHSLFYELLGDTFFRLEKYGKAVDAYELSFSEGKEQSVRLKLADSLVTVMKFREAAQIYEDLYRALKDESILRKMYFLERLSPDLKLTEKFKDDYSDDLKNEYEAQFSEAMKQTELLDSLNELSALYEKGESVFLEEAKKRIVSWKQQYRNKV